MNLKQTLLTVTAAAGLFGVTAVTANADTVTVKPGDTVSDIAAANHTTIAAIEKANELADINFILPGQKLDIDGEGNVKVVEQPKAQVSAQAPVKAQTPVKAQAPVQVQQPAQKPAAAKPAAQKTQAPVQSHESAAYKGTSSSAKDQLAQRESGGSYTARNGQFIGKYQLGAQMLNGDYSEANQEKVADQYVEGRYGSWENALKHSDQTGWY
ncbi:LysM peptidoglycan-binding domain-containing protein [Ligilactobacillus pobuzihii]|uniref:aggregation-promoting factor n=1 Tax=Ligilactobacillus pobuzihii TaxID=449659 RepID=UPI0019D005B3|nr:LysM domain-containing protein [Ligilactobacillus pobuzihii]MBN7274183.1 LysM peptidoglycan-binding domain-containing protein [Ligilactobacillus pobuzihii]